jgi:putative ABC transport system permease protein
MGSFAFLKYLIPGDLSHAVSLAIDLPVLGFTILVSITSSFLFGLAPALEISKTDLNTALREGGRGTAGARQTLGSIFVAGEVALSLMLLVGAGLLLKSLFKLRHVDPGFQSAHVLTLDFDMAEPRYRDWAVRTRFLEHVLERTRALPGVESAGFAGGLPLSSRGWTEDINPEDATAWHGTPADMIYRVITPGYLETLRIPLIRGRFFDSRDRENTPLVAIVNRKAARDFWPHQEDPIGKRLKLGRLDSANPWMQVVGVTGDVKQAGLAESSRQEIYCPYLQTRATLQWQRAFWPCGRMPIHSP